MGSSMRKLRVSRWLHQILTLGIFLGLTATWTHVHADDANHAAPTQSLLFGAEVDAEPVSDDTTHAHPELLPDDAHHEHSPTLANAAEPCFGCRTRQDAEQALARKLDASPNADFAHHDGDTSPIPCDSTDRRLPGVRAPPPCRA